MLTVIGCGNLNRSDDGVGVVVARRLLERLRRHPVPQVQVFDCGTAGMEVMFAARGSDALLILDAARTGSEPGAIFEVPGEEVAREHEPSLSLHDFRWDHALGAGQRIFGDEFPKDVQVWLVEAERLDLGTELTARVAEAADRLYDKALAHIASYAVRRHDAAAPLALTIKRGSLQLPHEVYDRFFDRHEGAVLFDDNGRLCVMPVASTAGGSLVKHRTARGDRSIDLTELLRLHGWDDWGEYTCRAAWDPRLGALSLEMPDRSPR